MLGLVRQIMRFCGPYAKRIRIAWIFAFLKSLCANAPIVVAVVLVNMLVEGMLDAMGCIVAAVLLLALIVLQSVFQNAVDRLQSAAGYEIFAEKRMEFAAHLRRLPMGYFSAGTMGKISSILLNDMTFIEEQSMRILADVASDVFAQAIIVAFLFFLHPFVGAAALACVAVACVLGHFMNREALADSARRQQSIEDLSAAVLEYAAGIAVNKSFNRAGAGAAELRAAFSDMTASNLAFEHNHAPWERRLLIVYALGMTAVAALSVWLLSEGTLALGSFIGVMLFVFNLFAPLKHLYLQDTQVTIMKTCMDRLREVIDEPELPDDGASALLPSGAVSGAAPDAAPAAVPDAAPDAAPAAAPDAAPAAAPDVEFRDVTFGYGGEAVLSGVSFAAERGQTVALVGQSGSGKTTVANLLARFWDVQDGAVLVRGVDVRDLPMSVLMGHLSMVFQRVYLFEDTVFNNIAMGNPTATRERVEAAARKARCHDFISALPYGYDTVIGAGGASLSGGEAQRISIARCILKDAPIVILDEATANLDADNESAIQQAMTELCREKTTIVIAHRLNTIANADKVIVLDAGRVAEAGMHDELLAAGGLYARTVAAAAEAGEWSER